MTDEPAPQTQMTCPRCGSARSKSATFCGVCGQDLRPGAPVTPLPPPPSASNATAGVREAKPRRGLLRRKPQAEAAAVPPAAPAGQSGIPATGPMTMPGSPPPLPTERPAAKPDPAVVPKPDTTLSFSERYRGTQYSNPDIERLLPPPARAKGGRRWGRIAVVAILFIGTLAVALTGGWLLFFSPGALSGPTVSASQAASGSSTPRPTATPRPTIHGLIADEVEIAVCLLRAEDGQRQGDLAALRADALAGGTADLATRGAAVRAAVETSRSSLPIVEATAETQALAKAWIALYDIESDALSKMATASDDAAALKASVKRLDEAKAARKAVNDAYAALVVAFPETTCTVTP